MLHAGPLRTTRPGGTALHATPARWSVVSASDRPFERSPLPPQDAEGVEEVLAEAIERISQRFLGTLPDYLVVTAFRAVDGSWWQAAFWAREAPERPPDGRFGHWTDVVPTVWQPVDWSAVPRRSALVVLGLTAVPHEPDGDRPIVALDAVATTQIPRQHESVAAYSERMVTVIR
jgi:hypothetical protein